MSFIERLISVSVGLASNSGTNQSNVFNLPDGTTASNATFSDPSTGNQLRTKVRIQNSGAPSQSTAQVDIYGLPPSVMNQLSTLGVQLNVVPKNTITIQAGDAQNGMSTVFTGIIQQAYGDFNAMPESPFRMECQFGFSNATALTPPASFAGSKSVSSIMQNYATQLGCGFENNGVTATLSNPYLKGSLIDQVSACRDHAGISAEFVDGGATLAIFPKWGSRQSSSPPVVSAISGEGDGIGYPSYTQQGILVHTLFNPAIKFFGQIQVNSTLPKATGLWVVHKMDLALDAQLPKGEWKMDLYCYNPNSPTPVITPP
jgi:hypothetical protein